SIDYWEFITKESFEETVMRAYLISFLISGGYVKLKIDPIEERMTLIPRKIDEKSDKTITMPRSIAISLDYERWRNVLEVRKGVGRG
ncbi:MAG: non-structural maintenance of chromosomes element 4, partial [Nitrososphaerales archaeon]|nr:non-structural maintenance of chromosomes element 4 [Nitrososphaerales archaeon]